MSTPNTEELEIDGPTPMMEAWRKDADEFGIPFQIQKGLMFLTSFGLRASYQTESLEDWIGFTSKLSNKIRLDHPHIPEGKGGDFYDQDFSSLMTEFAERFTGGQFSPREINSPAGDSAFAVWHRNGSRNMLPECLCEGMWHMSDWDVVMTSLCDQLGKGIRMNLEGAYLAGFLYFESQWHYDQGATQQLSYLLSGMLPPKFMWFRHMLNFDANMAGQGNAMQKILDCFLQGVPSEAPLLYRLVTFLSDQLHYKGPGQKNQRIWDAFLVQFACVVLSQRNWFSSDAVGYFSDYGAPPPDGPESDRQGMPALIEYLEEKEWEVPDPCSSLEEALATVAAQIEARWGYRIMDEDEVLTPADSWTRRACVLHVYTVNTILSPDWNKFEQ